jgi:hypothetical protein
MWLKAGFLVASDKGAFRNMADLHRNLLLGVDKSMSSGLTGSSAT